MNFKKGKLVEQCHVFVVIIIFFVIFPCLHFYLISVKLSCVSLHCNDYVMTCQYFRSIVTLMKVFSYIIEGHVCYLTLCDRSYPKKLAFQYLEELKNEFERVNGNQIETAARPYAFVKFGMICKHYSINFPTLILLV